MHGAFKLLAAPADCIQPQRLHYHFFRVGLSAALTGIERRSALTLRQRLICPKLERTSKRPDNGRKSSE